MPSRRAPRRSEGALLAIFADRADAAAAARRLRKKGLRRFSLLSAGKAESDRARVSPMRRGYLGILAPGEAAIAMRPAPSALTSAAGLIREAADMPPAVFLLHDAIAAPQEESRGPAATLSRAQVERRAARLASEHRVRPPAPAEPELTPRLRAAGRRIQEACLDLSESSALGQGVPVVAEWMLDNEFIIDGNIRDILVNLPRAFTRRLPVLAAGRSSGLPRIYDIARELIEGFELRADKDGIVAFLDNYQEIAPLTIGELWALPQMLRLALIEGIAGLATRAAIELRERESADFWANRLIAASRSGHDRLFAVLSRLAREMPEPSPYFAAQLAGQLYDEDAVLALAQSWLDRCFRLTLEELGLRERTRQAKDQVTTANAFSSLRYLDHLDWKPVFERTSGTEALLRAEASGIYPRMDFATRDLYRRAVEALSRSSGRSEKAVADAALALAEAASLPPRPAGAIESHVGYYLAGEGRPALAESLGGVEGRRHRALQWAYRRPAALFFIGLSAMTLAAILAALSTGLRGEGTGMLLLAALLAFFPASQLALEATSLVAARLLPARPLPKMDFSASGIPDRFRTLVVVPALLGDEESVRAEVGRLEVRYLANKDANLLYGLFSDYLDADEARTAGDAALLGVAAAGIEALDLRYGGGRFFLLHRERTWSESEGKHIGWERKRGKLEELNALISGRKGAESPSLIRVGDAAALTSVRFVITLDSDTQLPLGTARRLVETIAHPLNEPRLDETGRALAGGYAIIQPRVSTSMPSARATVFSRLFTDAARTDPYSGVASDLYQDLAGEGSYYGKGIYDVRAFDAALGGRFPEGRLLSHDLIEGAHVRVGLASDIELLDDFPASYGAYARRQHRWIRGDWQIAQWITPRVPSQAGGSEPNPLSPLDRWKLFDNLRRSLLPAGDLVLLAASWAISPRAGLVAGILVATQLFSRVGMRLIAALTERRGLRAFSPRQIVRDAVRASANAALLPHKAWVAIDAIFRAAYRTRVSHRNMLQWAASPPGPGKATRLVPAMALASGAGIAVALVLAAFAPDRLASAFPWLAAWIASPLVARLFDGSSRPRRIFAPPSETKFLRELARRTWRYFDDFVGEAGSWLPPDNYQVSPRNDIAFRTSPTNIGLWMVSVVAARDFGYITTDQAVDRLSRSLESLRGLERYKGHLLNWYDLRTLRPLEPRYVSTVDSGNLIASLWAAERGLRALAGRPVLDASLFGGLADTEGILGRLLGRGFSPESRAAGGRYAALERIASSLETPAGRIVDAIRAIDGAMRGIGALADAPASAPRRAAEESYWISRLGEQLASVRGIADRYLRWAQILAETPRKSLKALAPGLEDAVLAALGRAPSLEELATGDVACIALLESAAGGPVDDASRDWIRRVLGEFSKSRWLAGEVLGKLDEAARECAEAADRMDLGFLYDPERRLFAVGYNVSEGRRDDSYYDLLASEARLGSFAAIARGDAPPEHWFALGRPYASISGRSVLLSWTGTMFEYLMPFLLQECAPGTLLDEAARGSVAAQMEYGARNRVPWGFSESAFADMDIEKTYQYRAFGAPALRLKRVADDKIVVAPYASFLALDFAPRKTVANLRRLAGLGLLDSHGFYDAIDFSRQPGREGGRGVVVQAYMAHHQGMSFLALANHLMDGAARGWFGADPRVRAAIALLHERVPVLPASHYVPSRDAGERIGYVEDADPRSSRFAYTGARPPRTQLLSNGRYALMVTDSGGGYSRWGDSDVTRWRSDPTRDSAGTFIYIRDREGGRIWSPSYHPVGGKAEGFSAAFSLDRAAFDRAEGGIHAAVEIVVSPEDDVEIRRLTLVNRTLRARRLDCTSYVELSMAPHAADRQHEAFSKLFVRTEWLPRQRALLASRRPRESDGPAMHVAHRLTRQDGESADEGFETDRLAFIGRGRTLADPRGASEEPARGEGYVLDPVLSLRSSIALLPGQREILSFVIAAADSRERAIGLMEKYADPRAVERAFDFAWAAAQLELRVLRIRGEDARRFKQLASGLLYPSRLLRAPAELLESDSRGQQGLWRYGISGDLPIALVSIAEMRDVGMVGQMLQAHGYWRMRGLAADLVILARESTGYERPLADRLEALVRAHSVGTGRDKPGGVFLRDADRIPEADRDLLFSAASVVLIAARGSLAQQAGSRGNAPDEEEAPAWKGGERDASASLPFLELPYFNGLGGFTPDGKEYAVYLGDGAVTPAPWINVLANPSFGATVGDRGGGFAWYGNSQRNRLTPWSNDPVLDPSSEAIYLRDEETGDCWTPTASPMRDDQAYRARHGAGYTVFEHNFAGIEAELTALVPTGADGGRPVKLQSLRLRNASPRARSLSLTYYVELVLGENSETSRMHVATAWDEELGAILARNRYRPDYGERVAFAALGAPADSYCGDRTAFLGRGGSMAHPAAMRRASLGDEAGPGLDPCAALRMGFVLEAGEETVLVCMLGEAGSAQEARSLVASFRAEGSVAKALAETKSWWDGILGAIEIRTPERSADYLVNRWLLYQVLSCRVWGRSAFYQSGGAFGFRDQLQDVLALLYSAPGIAREHILLAASRQFREGDVQHWWHPPSGAGIRSRISDDLLWLPYAVARYLRATGDAGVLAERIPYLEGPPLAADQREAFFSPAPSSEEADLYDHCRRAIERGMTRGAHGLPLMGAGDWNDGMNLVGAEGRGESVWLGWFLAEALRGMSEISESAGKPDECARYLRLRSELIGRIEGAAWDGDWYLRAISDDGSPIGSSSSAEARIDSIPQSWAILAGADDSRSRRALESARRELVKPEDGIALLLSPPFEKSSPSPGYIQAYPPGVRENGGQYTHAALWLAMATARSGDGTGAVELLRMLNPIERARDPEALSRYAAEPYAVAADVYALRGREGRGGWSWYTGSAAWMYRAWIEEVAGLDLRADRLSIDPVIPGAWDGFSIAYRYRGTRYAIKIENPEHRERGVAWVELDGRRLEDGIVVLEGGGGDHEVVARMGARDPRAG
jgi:cyclic beta-1,2-glucan synthetase